MGDIGSFEELAFPAYRNPTLDTLELGRKKHHIPLLLEVDVTEARRLLRRIKTETGEGLSFTGWAVACIGRAVGDHKRIHAMRRGRRRLVLFDAVDVAVAVERSVSRTAGRPDTLPMPYVIRRANEKSVREIHGEIRSAQGAQMEDGEVHIGGRSTAAATRLFSRLPKVARYLMLWRRLGRDPFLTKRTMGTVMVTSIGNAGQGGGYGWAVPIGIHPLVVALGRIAKKPGVVGEAIEIREFLSLTILFDHDVVDGAPAARFAQRLQELLESGYGLGP